MKRFFQAIVFLLVAAVVLAVVAGIVANVVLGKWLNADKLAELLEQEIAAEVQFDSVEFSIWKLGEPASVRVEGIELHSNQELRDQIADHKSDFDDQQWSRIQLLLEEPVLQASSASLEVRRWPLFRKELDVIELVLDGVVVHHRDLGNAGSTTALIFANSKDMNDEELVEQVTTTEVDPDEANEVNSRSDQTVRIQTIKIANSSFYYEKFDQDSMDEDVPVSVGLSNFSCVMDDVEWTVGKPLNLKLKLAGLLTVDEGEQRRWLNLAFDGNGHLRWDSTADSGQQMQWDAQLIANKGSFLWVEDLIDKFREEARVMEQFGLNVENWNLPSVGELKPGSAVQLAGTLDELVLDKELKAHLNTAWLRLDAGSSIRFAESTTHCFGGSIRPPQDVSADAYKRVPREIERNDLGGLTDGLWEALESAYFEDEMLTVPVISSGELSDIDFEVTPDPVDLIKEATPVGDIIDVLEGLFE